jgi:polyamine oxidase
LPISRRELLRTTGAVGAALALGGCGTGASRASARRREVIVIGAGMAGLAAARALVADDYDVLVLEGRDRIGGRTFTSDALGTPVDVGAAWIHGPRGNPLTTLARRAKARLVPTDNDAETLAGARDPGGAERECERLMAGLARLKGRLRGDISIAEGLRRLGSPADALDPAVRFCFDTQIEQELADDVGTLSLRGLDEDEELPGGDVLVLSGYSGIVRPLARGLDVRVGHRVTRVARTRAGVTVDTSRGSFVADRAVVTLPIGVLKSGAVRFEPGLPAAKRRAVARLGAGVLNKVALRFAEPFWPADAYWLGVLPGTGNRSANS